MYLYYEKHHDAHKRLVLTEMRLSSNGQGRLYIDHKSQREQTLKALCLPILKKPPMSVRSMDDKLWVWSYLEYWGERVIEDLISVTKAVGMPIGLIEVVDLAAQAVNNRVDLSGKPRIRPEDFFYNPSGAASTPALTKEIVELKLRDILGSEIIDKSAYRRAALRLHPDRNNGDGSKMSELNMLWRVYQE